MNQRIDELMIQASTFAFTEYPKQTMATFNTNKSVKQLFNQKFAELIVAECMNLAEAEQKRYASITHRNMSECAVALGNFSLLMEEHFGVEQ